MGVVTFGNERGHIRPGPSSLHAIKRSLARQILVGILILMTDPRCPSHRTLPLHTIEEIRGVLHRTSCEGKFVFINERL